MPLLLALLALAAPASAATPPTLGSPANGFSDVTEGGTLTYTWSGTLQGDPDALTESFYRIEIARAASLPAGQQAAWNDTENVLQTTAGSNVQTAKIGAPDAGTSWAWRVCAWGVADEDVSNELQQLPGGCSASRSFTTKAAVSPPNVSGEVVKTTTIVRTTPGPVVTSTQQGTAPAPEEPVPAVESRVRTPEPIIEKVIEEEIAAFQEVLSGGIAGGGSGDSSLGENGGALDSDPAADRQGLAGAVTDGLGASLPIVNIPIWSLLLLGLCVPVLVKWRRNALGMFEWSDGSVDGMGTPSNEAASDDLSELQHDKEIKVAATSADSEASPPSADRTAA